MVDAAIGGKTGVDLNNLKNIIGTFKYPKMIIVDQLFLKSISKRHTNSGFAEMIKHSLIDSKSHWEKIKKINSKSEITNDLVFESIMTKVNIVKNDPTESNIRKYLNFGHTLGHAIESYLLNSERELLHGESILIGLILELYISNVKMNLDLDLVKEIKIIIEKFSKKVIFSEEDIIQIIDLLKYDKKNEKEIPLFVLLESIGKPIFGIIVSKTDILNLFEFYDN
jgi:3-dehydroquinate synthase